MKSLLYIVFLCFISLCFVFGASMVAVFVVPSIYSIPFQEFTQNIGNTSNPEWRTPLLLVQGITQMGGFFAASVFFYYTVYKKGQLKAFSAHSQDSETDAFPLLSFRKSPVLIFLLVVVLAFISFPVVSLLSALNNAIELPASMGQIEEWMRLKEDAATKLTLFMTNFDSIPQTILGFIVVAIIAGLAEEFFFRGVLQPLFQRALKNPHAAIWVTAAIFSAIHLQFYGFFPRMLLGAIFGYLYVYTKNLSVPIWAHMLNNGITLAIAVIAGNSELINPPKMEGEQLMMTSVFALMSAALGVLILQYIKRKAHEEAFSS